MSLHFFCFYIMIILLCVVSVAFYTLMERKILGLSQNRKGPILISVGGILQPFSDAVKLLTKSEMILQTTNYLFYWISPFSSFFLFLLAIMIWIDLLEMNYSFFFFFCLISVMTYGIIFSGWSSNSKYSMLGCLRSMAQTISYEVILILSFVPFLVFYNTFNLQQINDWTMFFLFKLMLMPLIFFVAVSLVCEVNRAPADLAEGESELVSGFNTEYGGLKFALIFLSEYGMMIIMSLIFSALLGSYSKSLCLMATMTFMMIIVWLRASFPRIRYDNLMHMGWKNILNAAVMLSLFYFLIL